MNNANNINSHFGDDYTKFHEQVKSGKIVISPKFKAALDKVVERLKKVA